MLEGSTLTQIYQVVPEAEFEVGPDLARPTPKSCATLVQGRPGEGREKHVLRLHQVFCGWECPSVHKPLGFGEGRLVERGDSAGKGIDEVVQFVVGNGAVDPAVLGRG